MSFPVYVSALVGFVGWILFVFFTGIGMWALPVDLIEEFRFRPSFRTSAQMKSIKESLKQEVRELIGNALEV